jgi:hypothetical protein
MSKFKTWLEGHESEMDRQIRDIWGDTFKALGIGGLADEDAAYQSLSKIVYGQRAPSGNASTFKGKKAAYKRLENGQIFNRLLQLGDPEVVRQVEDAKQWLGTNDDDPKTQNNGDTTVSTLLQKLFGKTYQRLMDSDGPVSDAKLSKAPAMAPKNDMGAEGPAGATPPPPDPTQQQPPSDPAQMQQPPVPQQQPPQQQQPPVPNPMMM